MKFQYMTFVAAHPEQAVLGEVVEATNFFDVVRNTFFVKGFKDEQKIQDMVDCFTFYDDNGQQKHVLYGEEVVEIFFVVN